MKPSELKLLEANKTILTTKEGTRVMFIRQNKGRYSFRHIESGNYYQIGAEQVLRYNIDSLGYSRKISLARVALIVFTGLLLVAVISAAYYKCAAVDCLKWDL